MQNHWIAAILVFDFKLVHVPADKHKGPDSLSRHEPALGKEEDDNPEDWVDNALSLSTWVVSWLDPFPTDAHRIDALVLSLEVSDDDDDDFVQHNCSLAVIAALLCDAAMPPSRLCLP